MKNFYSSFPFFLVGLLFTFQEMAAQNFYNPDPTAYEYITRGGNLSQFMPSGLTSVNIDSINHNINLSSIRWTVPSNSGTTSLTIMVGDIDLRNKTIYSVCKRNNNSPIINLYAVCSNGSKFKVGPVIQTSSVDFTLPETEWQQMGSYVKASPVGGANVQALQHVIKLTFETTNCNEPMILWIDEIKMISPRGPACIVHFNRYRDLADSLLTPFLLQKNIKANIDFNFTFAKEEVLEKYSGVIVRAIGFNRIKDLVNNYGWSCTSHGTFYDYLPYLSPAERLELCQLDSFISNGFDARWCLSVPKDIATKNNIKEIKDWGFYKTIRRQGYAFNELPINNPWFLKFFRPTSASAGPNLNGTPLTISQMKNYVDSCKSRNGLIILDFGTIVTDTSSLYTDVETTMLTDATTLINYTDSLNIPFITFEDLLKTDSTYQQKVQSSDDYYELNSTTNNNLQVMENDLLPNFTNGTLTILNAPLYGTVQLNPNNKSFDYTIGTTCFSTDQFTYILTGGNSSDTSLVTIKRMGSELHATRISYCNPNTYTITSKISGGFKPFTYLWSNNSTTSGISGTGAQTYSITITDANGCSITDSIILPNPWSPIGLAYNSVQCSAGIPTCYIVSDGTTKWYDAPTGGNLLQTGDSVYHQSINTTTNFYVEINYGVCTSARIQLKAEVKKPIVNLVAMSDTIICQGKSVRLEAETDPELEYQWYKNGIALPGEIAQHYDANTDGQFSVTVRRPSDLCISDPDHQSVKIVNPIPTSIQITSTTPNTTCSGKTITLTVPQLDLSTYNWYQSSGGSFAKITATGNTYTFIAPFTNSTYRFYVKIINKCGSFTTPVDTFTFVQNINATLTANGPVNFCPGNSVLLNVSAQPGYNFIWKRDTFQLNNFSSNCLADTTGNYSVFISDLQGCVNTLSKNVYEGNPIAMIKGITSLCQGGNGWISASDGVGYGYQWYLNGFALLNSNNDSLLISSAGSYSVTISSPCGNTSSAIYIVATSSSPTLTIIAIGNTSFCNGDSVKLTTNSNQQLYNFQWYRNNIAIVGANDSTYIAKNTGNYKVTGSSVSNCFATSTGKQVTVISKPSVSIVPSGSTNFCSGGSVTLQSTTGIGYTYKWKKNNVYISGATNSTYTANSTGNYNVVITNSNGCSNTGSAVVVTGPPTVTVTPGGSQTICLGDSIRLNAANGYSIYNWLKNDIVIPGATSNFYFANSAGNYKVRITNQFGCSKTLSTANQVTILVPCRIYETDIKELSDRIHLAPNPANESVMIYSDDESLLIRSIIIYDLKGREVLQVKSPKTKSQINLANVPSGMYMVSIMNSDSELINKKLIVFHEK